MKYGEFIARIRKKEIEPFYLFAGEEDFLANEALGELKQAVFTEGEGEFNYDSLYSSDTDARNVTVLARTLPFMSTRRLMLSGCLTA